MKKAIYVPQGCYAKIIRTTPENQNVAGFITAGMDTCCHVIIANRITGYMVLSHADPLTNLEDSRHGVLAWIREVCPNGDYENLIIDLGENQTNPRFGNSSRYLEQINNALMQLRNEQPITNIQLTYHGTSNGTNYQYGISIFRDTNNFLVINERNIQSLVLVAEEEESGRELAMLEDERGALEGKINRARGYIHDRDNKTLNQDTRFPPICIFDGSSDKFLDLEIIKSACNQYGIDWEYVINSALPSSYGGSEIQSESSEKYSDVFENESRESNVSKTSEVKEEYEVLINQLNQILFSSSMHAVEAGAGGNCFFHAIAKQLEAMDSQKITTHEELRSFATQYMLNHPDEFQGFTINENLDAYIDRMIQNGTWADNLIIQALANELALRIDIYQADGNITHIVPTNNGVQAGEALRIGYTGNHYLSVEPNTRNLYLIEDSIQEEIDSAYIVSSSSSCNQKPSTEPTKAPTLATIIHQSTDSEFVNNLNQTTDPDNHSERENIDISLYFGGLTSNQNSGEL